MSNPILLLAGAILVQLLGWIYLCVAFEKTLQRVRRLQNAVIRLEMDTERLRKIEAKREWKVGSR